MMTSIRKILVVTLPILLVTQLYASLPGDIDIYIGTGSGNSPYFYTCVNVRNPQYADNTTIFSPENVCFRTLNYNNQYAISSEFQTTSQGTQRVYLLRLPSTPPVLNFEYLAGANILKSTTFSPSQVFSNAYFESQFVETIPTGFIKLLFNTPGTHVIRYIGVSKAVGSKPFIFYGPVLSKEEVLNEPPVVKLFSPAPGTQLIGTNVVNLVFQAIDPENRTMVCYYSVGGIEQTLSVLSGENVSIALRIDYLGNISINVICKDPFGLTGSASTYVIRESPPSSAIARPYEGELITTPTLQASIMVADNGPYMVCNATLLNESADVVLYTTKNITLSDSGVTFQSITFDMSNLPAGYYKLKVQCNDSVGLSTESVVSFKFALDPDDLKEYCVDVGGEWYGDHCCGDDPGEHMSFEAKGYPTPQAFDPATCSIIDLQPGQCDGPEDCPPSGWVCTSNTVRELRYYTCEKQPGQLIGTCQENVQDTQDCTSVNASYICTNGVCAPEEQPNQPPVITIYEPRPDQIINVTTLRDYITVTFKVEDENSIAVVCNLTLNDNIITLGLLNVSQSYSYNVTGIINGTNTLSITCMDSYNDTATASVVFYVNKVQAECITDTDCGSDAWQCISPTERAYFNYQCVAGKCVVNVTQTETAPQGYICMDGQFVSENTLRCTVDSDCPPDDRVCLPDRTGYVVRDWYCDTNTGFCKYNITQTVSCGADKYCLAGACWDKGEHACEGMILTHCIDNSSYIELVAVYKEDLGTCVYVPVGTFNCPSGTICFAGKCSEEPTGNLPPVIQLNITTKSIRVGEAAKIVITVTDDNTPVLFVNVTAQVPEIVQVFKGVAVAGKPFTVYYVPPHASTHVITVSATDQYGVSTTQQETIEVQEEAPSGGAGGAAPAGGGAAGGGGGGGVAAAAAAVAKPSGLSPILILVIGGVILVIGYFLMSKRR